MKIIAGVKCIIDFNLVPMVTSLELKEMECLL